MPLSTTILLLHSKQYNVDFPHKRDIFFQKNYVYFLNQCEVFSTYILDKHYSNIIIDLIKVNRRENVEH